jgi:hypothetical protein
MADIDAVYAKARATKSAASRLERAQTLEKLFCATPDYVYWGRPMRTLPGMTHKARDPLFYCEDPQAVADALNAALDKALAAERAAELSTAQAAYDAAVADLAAVTK